MRKLLLLIILSISTFFSEAHTTDAITGDWHGQLEIQGMKLRISFHIKKEGEKYSATMDSPDQGAIGIPTTATSFDGKTLKISMKNMGAEFQGKLITKTKNNTIEGIFQQAGMKLPLKLSQEKVVVGKQKPRPQDPVKPYPYDSQDVYFVNSTANNIKLAGTLTLPKDVKNPPVVVLISGSGPQNRDEEVKAFNHRPFLVWSDYLTRHGIAVLRYDDRGVGESQGTQQNATSKDFATDVQAAINYLKTRGDVIDTTKIGLIGHSEGGLIAPMVAADNKDVAFIVMLAGPGVDGGEVLLTQVKRASELAGEDKKDIQFNEKISKVAFDLIRDNQDLDVLAKKLNSYFVKVREENHNNVTEKLTDDNIARQVKSLSSPWLSYFIRTNPADFLEKVTCPVLAINGSLDFQVIADLNLPAIKQALQKAHNKNVTIKELKGLNHLFQEANTGAADEYAKIEQTVSPIALKTVADWISANFTNE